MPRGDKYQVGTADHEPAEGHHLTPTSLLHASTYRQNAAKLRARYHRHRDTLNVGNLEREQSFSWLNCLLSLFAYALTLSDVFRTGLAIGKLPYPTIEPDSFLFIGPYGYVTKHLTLANATLTESARFWTYKYDTTSVTMRAIAEYLDLEPWPACVLYKERCDETHGIPLATVFPMVESLVDGMAKHEGIHETRHDRSRSRSRGILNLRTESEYKDRVHHYALPWFFQRNVLRTTQAIHYTYDADKPATPPCNDPISLDNREWNSFCLSEKAHIAMLRTPIALVSA